MKDIVFHESDLRWTNRSSFVQYIQGAKQSDFCILTLSYNNIQNTQGIIDRLTRESGSNLIDVIIVDNSTEQQYNNLKVDNCNVTYIRPNQNLGSAGGYALGMEYLIEQGYDYFCMIEDDIILVDNETFTQTYHARQKDRIIYINSCLNTGGKHSWYVQYACYPIEFIKKVGVIDPRYFFRSEDLEWRIRIEAGIEKYQYHKFLLDKNYYHPYLKKVNGSSAWSYFALRNQLFMIKQHFSLKSFGIISMTILLYLWNGCVRSLFLGQYQYLTTTIYSIGDFLLGNWGLKISQYRTKQFSQKYIMGKNEAIINIADLTKNYNLSLILENYMFSQVDILRLQKVIGFHSSSVLIGGWNVILYPIFIFFSSIVSIDEFILGTDNVIISNYRNSYSLVKGMISLFMGICLVHIRIGIIIVLLIKFMLKGEPKND